MGDLKEFLSFSQSEEAPKSQAALWKMSTFKYGCELCTFRCEIRDQLYTHMSGSHPGDRASCSMCPRTFLHGSLLYEHIMENHVTMKVVHPNKHATKNRILGVDPPPAPWTPKPPKYSRNTIHKNVKSALHVLSKKSSEEEENSEEKVIVQPSSRVLRPSPKKGVKRRRLISETTTEEEESEFSSSSSDEKSENSGSEDAEGQTEDSEWQNPELSHLKHGCKMCQIYFENATLLSIHQLSHSDLPQGEEGCSFKCNICDKVFASLKLLTGHLKNCHNIFACPVCGKEDFGSSYKLGKHVQEAHSKTEQVRVKSEPEVLPDFPDFLEETELSASLDRMRQTGRCPHCQAAVTLNFEHHLMKMKCPLCYEESSCRGLSTAHNLWCGGRQPQNLFWTEPGEERRSRTCSLCSANHVRPDKLTEHLNLEHMDTLFKCNFYECNLYFRALNDKERHFFQKHSKMQK